jgi:hypothetical protein
VISVRAYAPLTMTRLLAVAATLLLAMLVSEPAAPAVTSRATLRTFAGGWNGHDRGMSINRWGRGFAQINSGASCPCFGVAFQLSRVRGTTENATATETVVRLYGAKHGYPATPPPLPRIGQRATLRLHNGIIDEVFTGDDYCGRQAKALACGA